MTVSWKTKDGQILDVQDMSDDHLENARNAVAANKINPFKHSCCVVDILDGPCLDCEEYRD